MSFEIYHPLHVYHPPAASLPPGFKYPKTYMDYVNQENIPDLEPWWFMCHSEDTGYYDRWLDILKKQYPTRQLVPFAKCDLNDDVACFEPSDNPDLPAIYYIEAFFDAGFEERGYCETFEEWLEITIEEAQEYQSHEDEEDGEG